MAKPSEVPLPGAEEESPHQRDEAGSLEEEGDGDSQGEAPHDDQNRPHPRYSLPNEQKDFDFAYFQAEYKRNPKSLFDRIRRLVVEHDEQELEIVEGRRQTANLLMENQGLQSELLQALRQNRQSPALSDGFGTSKSTKLPHPPILTDGKDPKFCDWLSRVKNKLKANSDHYPTEQIKLAYVEGLLGGDAARYARERFQEEAVDPYRTVNDVLKYLQTIYEDPNRLLKAKDEFKKLYMTKTQPFHAFYVAFLQQASEAKLPASEYKYELNTRLSFDLQRAVLIHFNDNEISATQFASYCTKYDHSLRGIAERENRVFSRQKKDPVAKPTTSTAAARSSPRGTFGKEMDRTQLRKEGRCYNCGEVGHMALSCTKKNPEGKKAAEVQELETIQELDTGNELP